MITIQDVVVVNGLRETDVSQIVNNTVNTWQPDRSLEEKYLNTQQGKLAENAVHFYLNQQLKDGWFYVDYDQIRTDNFQKHAPFDGIIMSPESDRELSDSDIFQLINDNVNHYGQLDTEVLLDLPWAYGCEPIEIKSTKLSDKIVSQTSSLREALSLAIQQNHFLTYPVYKRYSTENMNFNSYCAFLKSKYNLSTDQIIQININKHCNVHIHVYVVNNSAFIIGYTHIVNLIGNKTIQRFYKKNKSEYALYFSYPLHLGFPISLLAGRIMDGDRLDQIV